MENFNPFSKMNGGDDGTRTRDLCRDRAAFDTFSHLLENSWNAPSGVNSLPPNKLLALDSRYIIPRFLGNWKIRYWFAVGWE